MVITFSLPLTGRAAFSSSSAPSTFRTASASSRILLSRARPVLGDRHVMRAGPLSKTSHRGWVVLVACAAPDGKKRASTVVTHHSPRAQHEARWNLRLQELREFKDEHGHLVVPLTPEHRPLHNWVYQQRRMYREGKLVDTRIAPLDAIGFEWTPTRGRKTGQGVGETRSRVFQDQWNAMFDQLLSFHEENGHCKVPKADISARFCS